MCDNHLGYDVDGVRRYIVQKAPDTVMARDGGLAGKMALHIAAEEGQCEILRVLMDSGGPQALSVPDHHRETVVHYAAKGGYLDMVQYVVAQGGRSLLLSASSSGMTPAHMAAGGRSSITGSRGADSVAVLRFLVDEMGPMVLLRQNHKGETPLHVAILTNRIAATNYILKLVMGGDPVLKGMLNIQDKAGNTPLHLLLRKRAADKELMQVGWGWLVVVLEKPTPQGVFACSGQ